MFKKSFKYGLILAGILILIGIAFQIAGSYNSGVQQGLVWLTLLVGLFFCLKHYRDNELEGELSYGKALGIGIVMHFWVGIFSGIGYVINVFINPKLQEIVLEQQYQGMVNQGLSDEDIAIAMEYTAPLMSLWVMPFWVLFVTVFMGVFISLVVGAIVQKKTQ